MASYYTFNLLQFLFTDCQAVVSFYFVTTKGVLCFLLAFFCLSFLNNCPNPLHYQGAIFLFCDGWSRVLVNYRYWIVKIGIGDIRRHCNGAVFIVAVGLTLPLLFLNSSIVLNMEFYKRYRCIFYPIIASPQIIEQSPDFPDKLSGFINLI